MKIIVPWDQMGPQLGKIFLHKLILAPQYLEEVITVYRPKRSVRSENSVTLIKPRSGTSTYWMRRSDVAEATLWNSLPDNLRLCQSLNIFKKKI
jgi:hypothetical protein